MLNKALSSNLDGQAIFSEEFSFKAHEEEGLN